MWTKVVEEHCLENPNLVLQPAEISSVVTSLLQAVSQVLIIYPLGFNTVVCIPQTLERVHSKDGILRYHFNIADCCTEQQET